MTYLFLKSFILFAKFLAGEAHSRPAANPAIVRQWARLGGLTVFLVGLLLQCSEFGCPGHRTFRALPCQFRCRLSVSRVCSCLSFR